MDPPTSLQWKTAQGICDHHQCASGSANPGLQRFGVLAFGGIGGIAVGFAAKDLLPIFSGLMVYLDRPFSVGDWVRSPEKNIEGTVEHIGWRTTVFLLSKSAPYM